MQQYADVIIDPQGNVVAGAQVYILNSSGQVAEIFSSNSTNSPQANPIRTGSLGEFSFYARNGRYRIGDVVVAGKVFPVAKRDILLNDPSDNFDLNVQDFGANPSSSSSINARAFDDALVKAQGTNTSVVRVDGGNFDITGVSREIHNVMLLGSGSISGAYRKEVIDDIEGPWVAHKNFSVAAHAPRLISAKRPKVVLVGDSIAAFTSISSTDKSDNLEYMLRAKLAEAFPYKEIDFVNRAVGGKRYYDLGRDDVADLSSATWYAANPGRPWMDYVRDEAPDVVFISFGMNDGYRWDTGNFPPNSAFAVVEKLRAFPKKPDIVFCTNVLPSLASTDENYSGKAAQEGRDAIAGFTRTWAAMMGCGYLDFNRAANALRDGRDILDCYLKPIEMNVQGTFPFEPGVEARDYSAWFKFDSYPAGYLDAAQIGFALSSYAANIFVLSSTGGFFRVQLYTQGGGYKQYDEITDVAVPAAGSKPTFEFSLSRNRVELLIDGKPIFKGPVLRYGGAFSPRVFYTGSTPAGVTRTMMIGIERRYKPRVVDSDIYRTDLGGNLINHMNSAGVRTMFSEVLDRADWHAPAVAWHPAFHAQRLLRGHDGLAIDFAAKQFAIKSEDTPALSRSGDPASIITMVMGAALEYVTDPATGVTIGIRCAGALGFISLALLPAMPDGVSVIVEAYQETTGVTNHLFAMTRDGENTPRIHARVMDDGTAKMATYDDTTAISVNLAGLTTFPLTTSRFNRFGFSFKTNNMKLVANGQGTYGRSTKVGAMPSALTRLRIGYDNIPQSGVNPIVIRSIIVIPRALSHNELNALTF